MPMTPCTLRKVMPSPRVTVGVAESLNRDLGKVGVWCSLRLMELNGTKTETIIVFRPFTMHLQSPELTLIGTVLKEYEDRDTLPVI